MQIGCLARHFNPYKEEVEFAQINDFQFMQIWYDSNGIALKKDLNPIETIKQYNFPTIIHAVLDLNEFEENVPKLIEILKYLGHHELIIHPICKSEEITPQTIYKLSDKVSFALDELSKENITLYLENNSRLDPIFNQPYELEIMFKHNPTLQFLLDIAHIDSYEHLKSMITIKMPKILHIADRHLEVIHEHLPIGQGNIDYKYIFTNILKDFHGKLILEIVQSSSDMINSKAIIKEYLGGNLPMSFDNYAKTWDTDKRINRAKIIAKEINKSINIDETCSAMEFGCGTGLVSFNLYDKFKSIALIDSSKGMIDILNSKISKYEVTNMFPHHLDISIENSFEMKYDVIYTSMVLHHINDTKAIINNFYQLLNKNGYLCIVDLDEEDGTFHKEYPEFEGHNGFNQDDLKNILINSDFKDVESNTFFYDNKIVKDEKTNYSLFLMKTRKSI